MVDTEQTVKVELTMEQYCWLCNSIGATPKNSFRFHEDLDSNQWGNLIRRVIYDPENSKKLLEWCEVQTTLESEGSE